MTAPVLDHGFPSYVLFTYAAKHAMDYSLHLARSATQTADSSHAAYYAEQAGKWRASAWSHLAAARVAKEKLAA